MSQIETGGWARSSSIVNTVLVTGGNGQLATDLAFYLSGKSIEVKVFARGDLDVTKSSDVEKALFTSGADWVVNCAALTDLDRSEANQEEAFEVNFRGAQNTARACRAMGTKLIHISTDAVFASNRPIYLDVNSPCNPISKYGLSKLMGENAVSNTLEDYWILRSSWIYGLNGSRFFNTILEKVAKYENMRVVKDQFGQPTTTRTICYFILRILRKEVSPGIHHVVPLNYVSRFEFAQLIEKAYRQVISRGCETLIFPVLSSSIKSAAPRAIYSLLKPSELAASGRENNLGLFDEVKDVIYQRLELGKL